MSALEEMRAKVREAPKKKGTKKVWVPPEVEDFAYGEVLCFDQTLSKTGVSLVTNDPDDGLCIRMTNLLLAPCEQTKGFEQTFARAFEMGRLIDQIVDLFSNPCDAVIHEMPSVQGRRIESSLMAAHEVRRSNWVHYGRPLRMISRLSAYATLTGERGKEKRHMTEAVERLVPKSHRAEIQRWNQDVHDSAGLGLKYLYDRKQDERKQEQR